MSDQENKSTSAGQNTLNSSLTLDSIKLGLKYSSPRWERSGKTSKRTKSIYHRTPSKPLKKRVYFNPKLVVEINVECWKKYNSGSYTFEDDDSVSDSRTQTTGIKKIVPESDCTCCILI